MAMRVTQGMMYSSFVSQMNMNLSAYMESNMQSSSQKRVNRPSDDPVSAGRILSTRADIASLEVYDENIKQAMGWLNLADNTLTGEGSVFDLLTSLRTLAEQGSTGTYTSENRQQIAEEARGYFEQLVTLANTRFEGRSIFAGHKVDGVAYEQGLGVSYMDTTENDALSPSDFHVFSGDLNKTVIIQAVGLADGTDTTPGQEIEASEAKYRYSDDGGTTWHEATVNQTDPENPHGFTINAGAAVVHVRNDYEDAGGNPIQKMVTVVDPENEHSNENGTWIYVRPTAIYKGDDDFTEVTIPYLPGAATPPTTKATGHFTRDVIVRLDEQDAGPPPVVNFSYSVDDGKNWIPGKAADDAGNLIMGVPGGNLAISGVGATEMGTQFVIHPHRADINFQISQDDNVTVNMVGTDIFGGLYDYADDTYTDGTSVKHPVIVGDQNDNLFEVVGALVGALETGSQQGCQEALANLKLVMDKVLAREAEIGGRENRLISSQSTNVMRSYAEQDNLSFMEDVDFTELMTRLSQQQIAYNSVLKSSSMIMQMSLVNFL